MRTELGNNGQAEPIQNHANRSMSVYFRVKIKLPRHSQICNIRKDPYSLNFIGMLWFFSYFTQEFRSAIDISEFYRKMFDCSLLNVCKYYVSNFLCNMQDNGYFSANQGFRLNPIEKFFSRKKWSQLSPALVDWFITICTWIVLNNCNIVNMVLVTASSLTIHCLLGLLAVAHNTPLLTGFYKILVTDIMTPVP